MIMIIENKRGGGFDRQSSGDPDRTEGNWRSAPKSFDGKANLVLILSINR
jgi:hypothetical protein